MVRIGIIGLGFMGRMHLETYAKLPNAQIVAVCDADPRRAAGDLSGGWGNVAGAEIQRLPMDKIRGTTVAAELLAMPDVDVVDICLPTPAHVESVTEALASGKHVICEKPLAGSPADARMIAEAAASARGFFMPAMCIRFWPQWHWLKETVDAGTYGKLQSLTIRRLGTLPAGWFSNGKLSGGAILDLHVHDTDFIFYLLGRPAGVFTRGRNGPSGEIDHLLTQYLFDGPDAPMVSAEGSWMMTDGWPFSMRFTAVFERATADFDSSRTPTLQVFAGGKAEPVSCSEHDGYFHELEYLVRCVESGTRPTRVTAADAVTGLEIVEAERRSIASGRVESLVAS